MKQPLLKIAAGIAAVAAAAISSLALPAQSPAAVAAPSDGFVATFDSPADFYDRFDYGFSGQDPASNHNPDRIVSWVGDHDDSCGGPTTQRTINIDRDTNNINGGSLADFDRMFWWCREHLMTAVSSVGYSIAWFSPKPYFTDVTRVCWDLNVTQMSSRKWTQVLFVSEADATANPSSRGSGGFDLGYTNPIFRDQPGSPSAGILPHAGDLAGLQVQQRGYFGWFENQDHWTSDLNGAQPINGVSDKAGRYTHCIEQLSPGTVRFTQQRPASHGGFQQVDVPGTIPRGPVRVVFQDDNYNGPKGELYDPNANTWHWDNIVVETGYRTAAPTPANTPEPATNSARLLDTRSGSGNVTADGQFQHIGKLVPGQRLEVQIAGRNGIPSEASAAFLNVTVTGPDGPGYVTVYPCGSVPNASTVNYTDAGQTVANLALTELSDRGTVCLSALTATDVVIDATGYTPTGSPATMTPTRLLDTRSGSGNVTADGQYQHVGRVVPGSPLEVRIAGRGGVPDDARAAFLNVAVTGPDGPGYVTAYPCGSVPNASTVNYTHAGQTVANLALTKLSERGTVCIAALTATDVVIDATGYSTSDDPATLTPTRLLETRSGNVTADGQFQSVGKVNPGSPLEVQIAGRGGIPEDATAAFLNVTVTLPEGPGYVTVYPCGGTPNSSTVNYTHGGQTVANLAVTELSDRGTVCIATLSPTHVILDATGFRR